MHYCLSCALTLLPGWQGWPLKDPVISLPRMIAGRCENCGGVESLSNERIAWNNYHGPYNTGLPDYWLLVLDNDVLSKHWGSPYFDESNCEKCAGRSIGSEMLFPNGEREVKTVCTVCGSRRSKRGWPSLNPDG